VSADSLLSGRTALVSGGSRGIGRAICLALADSGANVAVNYRQDESAARETVAAAVASGAEAEPYQASVDSDAEVASLVERVVDRFGGLDLLVNNAGRSSRPGMVADTEPADLERTIATMAFGSHYLCRRALPSLRDHGGDIVFISSQSAVQHNPYGAPYNMAKAAVESLAYTLAQEEGKNGIRVNIVAAGLVDTDLGRKVARAATGIDNFDKLADRYALGRAVRAADVAAAVRFLVSQDAATVTGQRVAVDAGGFRVAG
jgi:NAD(P)-dependent dehydrogenase (short-subunit alcohol dehydrogenase family)